MSQPPVRPFRFLAGGVEIVDGKALADKARRAESIGYSVLVLSDHLLAQLAPIPAMATIAAATERLRVGTFVFNNDLRHPAVLAQDLATLDVLSNGRLEIGIGAGWNEPEYEEIGLPFEPVATRVGRLAESVAVLKGLFGDGPFSFDGTHYTTRARDGQPKPVQKPHPPLMIGGGGRRVLSLAAREANIVSLAPRIAGARVLDGYAGTGAVGIEALSRGAAMVTFVENDRRAQALIAENLAHCGVTNGYAIIRATVARAIDDYGTTKAFDIVLLDPPYEDEPGAVIAAAGDVLAPGGLLVLEHARRRPTPDSAGALGRVRGVTSGDSALALYELNR